MDAASISLNVAALDLKMVQLITGAMRAVDNGPGARLGVHVQPEPVIEPRRVFHPTPHFEPRTVYHPEPRFEPRPVMHPTPRVEPEPFPCDPPPCPHKHCSPLPAPWEMPVWNTAPVHEAKIKIVVVRPDIHHKGTLLDCFI
jgi:hypothetical protein